MTGPELERHLSYLPTIIAQSEHEWPRDFARSLIRQSKRHGWKPSPKQAAILRRLVSELFTPHDTDLEVIE